MDTAAVDEMLVGFLNAQRRRALEILAGLDDKQLLTPALPSGWTPLGLIEHLGHAERHWFQQVALGAADPLPWPDDQDDDTGPLSTPRTSEQVFAFYQDQITRANEVVASTPLSTAPQGRHGDDPTREAPDLRVIVVHMIEETARHLGHLDAARELIDGRTGLGPDDL